METMLLRIFQQQVLLQCEFFFIAAQALDASIGKPGNVPWFAIEGMLNATANISKALWGQGGSKGAERKPLRESIGIADNSRLAPTDMRNHFEHFDERLTKWWNQSTRRNFIDLNFGDVHRAIQGIDEHDFLRNYNPQTGDVLFMAETFNLVEIRNEIQGFLPKLKEEASKPHWDSPQQARPGSASGTPPDAAKGG